MPIQITREEYEKKFGVKPFVPTTTTDIVDTKPAPIKITRAEWNAMQNQGVSPTFGQETKEDFLNMGAGLNQAVGTAGRGILDTIKRPDLSATEKTVLGGSKGFRGISDFLGEAFIGLSKLALPQGVENRIKEKFTEVVDEVKNSEKTDFRNPTGGVLIGQDTNQKISDFIFGAKDDVTERRTNDPKFKEFTDAAGNYAMGAADLYGAGKVEDVAEAGLKKGVDALPDISGLKNTVTNILDERSALKRQQDLYNIENNYDKLRKNMNKSSDANSASRARIAEAPIWDNVVDTDGKMTTLGKGGAYEQYQRATIDGRESIIRDNLVREGATVNINELAQALKVSVANTGLEGAALASALKGVQRELDAFTKGLSKRTDEFGNIPLEKVQDFKTSTTKTIDYKKDNTPTISFKKAKAQAYKEVIENKSKVEVVIDGKKYNVKGINSELAKYYKDLELISSLDGKRVKGGKLGKYFAQISGNLIGGAAGGAVGGPLGMAIGTVVGGEAGGFIKGKAMANSLGRGGKGIPANPVLDAARKQAGLPPVKDLSVPDRPVGAPKSIPKTKEVTKVEGQIKKNVAQQEAAIKAGDFGLVAELKEVYAYLVTKLKALIKEFKEGAKSQAGFVSFTGKGEAPDARRFKSKLDDEQMDEVLDELMNYDTDPITVKALSSTVSSGRKEMLSSTKVDDRLFDLQVKNNTKRLSKADIEEAHDLLVKAGVMSDLTQSKSLGKRQNTYKPIKNANTKSITQSSIQPREKNGRYGEKPKPTGIKDPTLKTKREVIAKDMAGNKVTIPQGEVITPYIDGAKVNITVGGKNYVIPKNQYQNLVGQSDVAKATPFAPELEGTVETVLSSNKAMSDKKAFDALLDERRKYERDSDEWNKITAKLESFGEDKYQGFKPKYSQYTLDGGENYREILIQAPVEKGKISGAKQALNELEKDGITLESDMDGGSYPIRDGEMVEYDELTKRQRDLLDTVTRNAETSSDVERNVNSNATYQSSHWSEPNVISHIRMNERVVDGKKYAFMEELQSDWAREGRDKGFIQDIPKPTLPVGMRMTNNGDTWKVVDKDGKIVPNKLTGEGDAYAGSENVALAKAVGDDSFIKAKNGVPNNPLLKNWQIPTVKRALMEAVDSGADRFAWINGEQTSARYNLATHVEEVTWNDTKIVPDGKNKTIKITPKGGENLFITIDNTGVITRTDKGDWSGKKLDEVLGKGLADKIMEKETGTLSGDGLSFGGEWAKNLYDKQVRDIVKKLTGAEVKEVDMGLPVKKGKFDEFTLAEGNDAGGFVTPSNLKKGVKVTDRNGTEFVVTDVLEGGEFRGLPVKSLDDYKVVKAQFSDKYKIQSDTKTFDTFAEAKKYAEDAKSRSARDFKIDSGNDNKTTQQYIDLTPEVKAKIQSKAPNFQMKNPSAGESLPLLLLLLGGGAVATQS